MSEPRGVFLEGARVVEASGVRLGGLRIEGGRISEGGARPRDLIVSLRDHLVFPGLLNAHDHLPLNSFPPLVGPGRVGSFPSAYAWIEAVQPLLDGEEYRASRAVDVAARAREGGLKNLLSGVTTVAHHDPWLDAMGEADFPVRVLWPYGWCHSPRLAGRYGPGLVESHAATPAGARWFVHLAEGTDEEAQGELAKVDALGLLGPRTVLVHGVGLTGEDVACVVASGASVVWCPASNLAILGATLDPRPLASDGRLALGTDSRLSGSKDLLDELRVAREVSGLGARDLLRLVTTDAARVLGLPGAGRLDPGADADLLALEDPGGDPYEALLAATPASVRAVVRAGVPRVAAAGLSERFRAAS